VNKNFYPLEVKLRCAGLTVRATTPVFFGLTQYRYTLYRVENGEFIAWFCWHAKPAVIRLFNFRPQEEGVSLQIIEERLSVGESKLVEQWFQVLQERHPVTSLSHPR
jgi:hypothetical protein